MNDVHNALIEQEISNDASIDDRQNTQESNATHQQAHHILSRVLSENVVRKFGAMPASKPILPLICWTRACCQIQSNPPGDFTEPPINIPDLQGEIGIAYQRYFARSEFAEGIRYLYRVDADMDEAKHEKTGVFRDAMSHVIAWALVQMGRPYTELRPLVQYASSDTTRARIIMMTAIVMLHELSSFEVHQDVVQYVNAANTLAREDDEVARLLKVITDLSHFIKANAVHLSNLQKISAFCAMNENVDHVNLIEEKQRELGYEFSYPAFSYHMYPKDLIGSSFVCDVVTTIRPTLPRGGLNFVDGVIYINLAHRPDRNIECRAELIPVFGEDRVCRLDATLCRERPLRGCNSSHSRALAYAEEKGFRTVLICEDDCQLLATADEIDSQITECFRACSQQSKFEDCIDDGWDVIMLGGYFPHVKSTSSPHMKQTHMATASHCYLVHGNYIRALREHIERCTTMDIQFDIGWWSLQKRDRWFVTDPIIAAQRDSHSDMTNQNVNMMSKSLWDTKMSTGSLRSFHLYKPPVLNNEKPL